MDSPSSFWAFGSPVLLHWLRSVLLIDVSVESFLVITVTMLLSPLIYIILLQRHRALHRKLSYDLAKAAHAARHDPLTGLPNRCHLIERMVQETDRSRRYGGRFAVIFLDLDGFKAINDVYGHAHGDALLRDVAVRLRRNLRAGDFVARIGGDEFVILALHLDTNADLQSFLRRLVVELRSSPRFLGPEATVSCSVGVSVFPHHGEDPESLLHSADAAMYKAKESGKNQYRWFKPGRDRRRSPRGRECAGPRNNSVPTPYESGTSEEARSSQSIPLSSDELV